MLTRGADIARVRARGSKIRGKLLDFSIAKSTTQVPRVGIVVPRHKHSAVARNTVKRRLREVIRVVRVNHPLRSDTVIVAKQRAYDATSAVFRDEVESLWIRAAAATDGP